MKKLFTLSVLALACGTAAMAQERGARGFQRSPIRNMASARTLPTPNGAAVITVDTLIPSSFNGCGALDSSALYYAPGASGNVGWLAGTNGYGDKEKGQRYRQHQAIQVTGVIAFIPFSSAPNNPDIFAHIYDVDSTSGDVDVATQIESDAYALGSIPATGPDRGIAEFSFSTPANVNGHFLAAVTVPDGATGDTVAILSTAIGCYSGFDDSYEMLSDDSYITMVDSWTPTSQSLHIDLFIWPITEFNDAVATLSNLSSATKVSPVPATNRLVVVLPANVKGDNNWQLIGMDGKVARHGQTSQLGFGVDGAELNGVYSLRVNTSAGPIVKRVVFNN